MVLEWYVTISLVFTLLLINYQGFVFRTIWTIQCKYQPKMFTTRRWSDTHSKAKYMYNQSTDFSIYQDGGNTKPNSFRGGKRFFPQRHHQLLIITTCTRRLPADRQWIGNIESRLLRIQQRLLRGVCFRVQIGVSYGPSPKDSSSLALSRF